MILIGSRALAHYGLKRKCIDWDFIGSEKELENLKLRSAHTIENDYSTIMKIGNEIVEFCLQKEADDYMMLYGNPEYQFGSIYYEIPDLEGLLAIKEATADFLNREKHFEDINWIYLNHPDVKRDEPLYNAKHEEIKQRIEKSRQKKDEFFGKYHKIEFIEHDKLHDLVSSLLFDGYPTFQYFVHKDTKISVPHWKAMSHDLKIARFTEESLVLMLERWFVPKLLKKGVYNPHIKKSMSKMSVVLAEHTIRGLRDEPKFMSSFGQKNRMEILAAVEHYGTILQNTEFPKWFYEELMKVKNNG